MKVKSTGIVRRVDRLGRVVLPIELRRTLEIVEGDEMEMYVDNERIILRKFDTSCVFCDSSFELVDFNGKSVCRECIRKMEKL